MVGRVWCENGGITIPPIFNHLNLSVFTSYSVSEGLISINPVAPTTDDSIILGIHTVKALRQKVTSFDLWL